MVNLIKISDTEFQIPKSGEMLVDGKIFADEKSINISENSKALEQVANVAKLPGIIGQSLAMPDIHQGYGFPIGGVAAFDLEKGVISPGGVGYDINCSVRLLKTNLKISDIKGKEQEIAKELFKAIPSGVGTKSPLRLSPKELDKVLVNGARWAIENGYGKKGDEEFIEENGFLKNTNPKNVSGKAKGRGLNQLGTLGAGNHFVDLLSVNEIFDEKAAEVFGLEKDQIVIMIHCGSRGLGHQVASDYIKLMEKEYGFPSFDRELVNAPIKSDLGQKYLSAMNCAANFAFANKQVLTKFIHEVLQKFFPSAKLEIVYEICHNIAKIEGHNEKKVLVMRKGATRSLGPNSKNIPEIYKSIGCPVLIPGSMGTLSYIMKGTCEAEQKSFSSASHGAGRALSRTESNKKLTFEQAKQKMEELGIFVQGSKKSLIEEFPTSYKNIDEVIEVTEKSKLAKKVASLKPIIVITG